MQTIKIINALTFWFIILVSPFNLYADCVKGDCINGQGTFACENGRKFIGTFKNGMFDGTIILEFADGKQDELKTTFDPDKNIYTIYFSSGVKFIGTMKSKTFEGEGTFIFPGENMIYKGKFKCGEITGNGSITYSNGMKYEGEIKDMKFHGTGTLTYPSGKKITGQWKDGIFIGK